MYQKNIQPFLLLLALLGMGHGQSLKGKITLSAAPKPLAPHQVTKQQSACGPQIPNEALLVGKKLELANVIVFLANIKPEANLPHAVIPLEMQNCTFKPQVLAVLQGDTLLLRNSDQILHDARGELSVFRAGWDRQVTKDLFRTQAQTAFNFVLPKPKSAAAVALSQPGLIRVHSETGHEGMQAYILVAPHRAFAVSNEKGEFVLPRLPGGEYDLILWHEHLGVKRQLVEVLAGKTMELLITWEIPQEMKAAPLTSETTATMPDSMSQK